ncbi:MAG: rhomboid family intramembrane serine protease [Spirochaetia bacterium]|jgi:membrane associated rhomboid family serine protease
MASILRRPLRYRYYGATIILIVVNIIIFLFSYYLDRRGVSDAFLLRPVDAFQGGEIWQVVTYMFFHAGWTHLFFNMLALFMFGIQLEQKMGSTEFLFYYFFSGIGAGLATGLLFEAMGLGGTYVLGASGAIFAVLLAFATFFPDARIFIFGILPMRAPTLVAVYAGIEIFSQLINPRSGVAHLAHLTGLAFGYLYLVVRFGMNPIEIFLKRR